MSSESEAEAAFRAHAEKVQADYLSLRLSEADTRSYLIDPVLCLLGYEGVKHLRRKMPVPATKEAIDYELLVDGKAHAIVEANAGESQAGVALVSPSAQRCTYSVPITGGLPLASSRLQKTT